tara:strand:+ start:284 stop:811 length:528 start_codon:yes stop_codon:yes gene_type:complete
VKKQDILENQVNEVYLGLGSNLGNKINNISKALYLISDENTKIIRISGLYETLSWPKKSFPKYINIVIKILTSLSPSKLFIKLKKIEKDLGRIKNPKNYPRECDIDILDFNQKRINLSINNEKLLIPHPRMHIRSFVLLPLFEIAKNWQHPISRKKIDILLTNVLDKDLTSIKLI